MMYLQRFDNSDPVAILNADGSVKQYYSRLGNALGAAKDGVIRLNYSPTSLLIMMIVNIST